MSILSVSISGMWSEKLLCNGQVSYCTTEFIRFGEIIKWSIVEVDGGVPGPFSL